MLLSGCQMHRRNEISLGIWLYFHIERESVVGLVDRFFMLSTTQGCNNYLWCMKTGIDLQLAIFLAMRLSVEAYRVRWETKL